MPQDPVALGALSFVVLFALIFAKVPIGAALLLTGVGGIAAMIGTGPATSMISSQAVSFFQSLDLAVIPLFLLMGNLAVLAKLPDEIFRLADALLGRLRGGHAYATIGGCAGFGAVCGSSIATVAVMTRVALPQMERRGYALSLASGTVAGGATLGVLIPPSIILVLYAVLTKQFVIDLFLAALIPSLIAIVFYAATIWLVIRMGWAKVPQTNDEDTGVAEQRPGKRAALVGAWRSIVLALAVGGGIYGGFFTVTEAAGVGVAMTFAFALTTRGFRWRDLPPLLADTAATTGMIYLVIVGAAVFGTFMSLTTLPSAAIAAIEAMNLPPLAVIFALLAMYLVLGAVFDTIGAMVLTLPFVFPLVTGLGFDPVWWGIVNVMMIEIGLVTPPIGMNVFVLHGMAPRIPLATIFRGVVPFVAADLVRVVLLILVPALVTWLPGVLN